MNQIVKNFYDLTSELLADTLLAVKYQKSDGQKVFVHYAIPIMRRNGTKREFGDLYKYFTSKVGFLFAIGYVMQEDRTMKFWRANHAYFYFDKKNLPFESFRSQKNAILLPKN